jgi:hypothetical protein
MLLVSPERRLCSPFSLAEPINNILAYVLEEFALRLSSKGSRREDAWTKAKNHCSGR